MRPFRSKSKGALMALATSRPSAPGRFSRQARVGVAVLFFTNGAIFASLLPRYPQIKEDLGLSNATFGAAVAAFPLGALLAGLTAGFLIQRFRSSRVAIAATIVASLGILLAGTGSTWFAVAGGLFIAGAMDSITDVAQNHHGLRVQRLYARSILNSFHAVWSVGAVTGGALGAWAAQVGISRALHLGLTAAVFSAAAVVIYRLLLSGPEPDMKDAGHLKDDQAASGAQDSQAVPTASAPTTDKGLPIGRRGTGRVMKYAVLAALVIIASSGALVEDAGSSWAAIYLTNSLQTSAFVGGFGFIALQGMQFVGRIIGDSLVDRFGQRLVARAGGAIVLTGMGLALLLPTVPGTIIGFGLAGLGVSTLIPAAMQAADELPGFKPGVGLTIVSWLLRLGFLVSPPVVGAIADATELRYGLLVVPLAGLLVIIFSSVLANRRTA